MEMEAEIISKEYIKPSSPTPLQNKTYTLSLLDQIVPPIYVPLVLYFPIKEHHSISTNSDQLKHSLSSTLSLFYPLAGRIKDKLSIDCNDQGTLFVVAKFSYPLSDFLQNPSSAASRRHIPTLLTWAEPGPGSEVAMVQLNRFSCGSIALGTLFLHKVADGAAIGNFMKSWAAASRGDAAQDLALPDYAARSLFPANESMQREKHLFSAMKRYFGFGKTAMRRYVFPAASISRLRTQITDPDPQKQRPTRVETVSAFLWKCFMAASTAAYNSSVSKEQRRPSLVTHGVNMRRKAEPPLPEQSFGNYVWLVPASASASGEDDDGEGMMKKLFYKVRESISKVDVEFVKRMQGEDVGFEGYCKNLEESLRGFPDKAEYLAISSWCNFGLYEVDFGWGRPAWMSKCDGGSEVEWPYINVLWLMDSKEGDGIEAWLTLEERCFQEFDKIQEISEFAFVDPSPLMDATHAASPLMQQKTCKEISTCFMEKKTVLESKIHDSPPIQSGH